MVSFWLCFLYKKRKNKIFISISQNNLLIMDDLVWNMKKNTKKLHVLSLRKSNSRKNQGIVTVETIGYKQTGEKVLSYERTFLVPYNT